MTWGAVGGAAISVGGSMLSGSKDSPDLQPWARVGEGMKRNYFPRVNEFADQYGADSLYTGTGLADQHHAVPVAQRQQLDLTGRWNEQIRGAADSIEGFIDYDPNSPVNQARRNAFSDQAMTNFNRNVRPAIEDRSTFSGQFGGPQSALAVGAAAGDTMQDINMFEANMMEADRQRALQATGMAPSLFAAQQQPLMNKEAIGNRITDRRQQELTDQIMQHNQPYMNAQQNIMDIAAMYNPFSGLGYQGTVGGSDPAQAAVAGATLGRTLFPDGFSNPFGNIFGSTTTPPTVPQQTQSFMPALDTSVITQGFG